MRRDRVKDVMSLERVHGTDDPRIVLYRDVSDAELMRSRGLFIAEGRLVVQRVIEDARFRVQSVLVSEAARRSLEPALNAVASNVPIYVCEAGDFLGITGHDIHRGCLALVERPPARSLEALLTGSRTLVVLEAVANADNVGGVFRNAAALGADAVLLSPTCCDPLYRKAIRTSMAAVLSVPFARAGDWPGVLSDVRAARFTIVALTPREPSETLEAFRSRPRPDRVALVVGAEGGGLTPAVEATADYRVRIPISDGVDSLNLAVSVGIALYELNTDKERRDR
ncbi:MAG TPA: RNA methyltransferase [Vicinamibacterales bacterium]|jgi:tRNA G18 (ribose-2'-O)-methylase SpoU|nr:RNA methyltransferase [Vicinamibacterales bacterium]